MVFGLNFNGTAIPDGPAFRKFPKQVKRLACNHNADFSFVTPRVGQKVLCSLCTESAGTEVTAMKTEVVYFRLQGIGQSPDERDLMLIQANNGHRRLHVETRKTAGGNWFGIYSY